MSGKGDFSVDEWDLLRSSPLMASMGFRSGEGCAGDARCGSWIGNCLRARGVKAAEKLSFVSGHDFSRAVKD